MKKQLLILPLVLLLGFSSGCKKQDQVERFMEEGVEVVVNHLEPYTLRGEPSNLILDKVLSIDTENEELAEYGLTDIWGYDANSFGEIFVFRGLGGSSDFIFKFDRKGEFIKSFGKPGQGPGEMQFIIFQKINFRNEITFLDFGGTRQLVYDSNGDLISETKFVNPLPGFGRVLILLSNGNYLYRKIETVSQEKSRYGAELLILDSEFVEIVDLGGVEIDGGVGTGKKFMYRSPIFTWGLSKEHIFVGNEENGYNIHVFDFAGQFIRKIRKEYTPVPFSKEQRKLVMKEYERMPSYRDRMIFPENNPPFQHIFADDLGRLYVVTSEPSNKEGEYIIDVFNPEGVFCSRLSLRMHINNELLNSAKIWDSWVTVKNNILYCVQQKESGHKELVAYDIQWR